MNQGLGLFNWIREGVRQSVLQGVSDAIDTIGAPEEKSELNPALLSFAKQPASLQLSARTGETSPRKISNSTGGRKRLGRSLRDLDPNQPNS